MVHDWGRSRSWKVYRLACFGLFVRAHVKRARVCRRCGVNGSAVNYFGWTDCRPPRWGS